MVSSKKIEFREYQAPLIVIIYLGTIRSKEERIPHTKTMNTEIDQISLLTKRLEDLSNRQYQLSKEILQLRNELQSVQQETKVEQAVPVVSPEKRHEETPTMPPPIKGNKNSSLERFVGENVLSKIGIVITVIGVAIGAKYSIDSGLINELTRILLGYLAGITLLGFGFKLKRKYEGYSAVLVSGAMCILYFITFFAYSYYELIPQWLSFFLMFIFTAFAAFAALKYNRQIIAFLGLFGAYAVPFLLSNNSGRASYLFSYILIINIGILIISIFKNWKQLLRVAFALTWIIFLSWFTFKRTCFDADSTIFSAENIDTVLSFVFAFIYFAIFYAMVMVYKIVNRERFQVGDTWLILVNTFLFYGIGIILLDESFTSRFPLSLFTLINAVLHLGVGLLVSRLKLFSRRIVYLIAGLVLLFITLVIPIQFDGNWVTLLWACEAALLFFFGRTKQDGSYECMSYALMLLATGSIFHDWIVSSDGESIPFWRASFLFDLLFSAAFAFILYTNHRTNYTPLFSTKKWVKQGINVMLPSILICSLYVCFMHEIQHMGSLAYANSSIAIEDGGHIQNYNIPLLKTAWLHIYNILFMLILSVINLRFIKNRAFGYANIGLTCITICIFLTGGLATFPMLQERYLQQLQSEYYHVGSLNIAIRYIAFAFFALLLLTNYSLCKKNDMPQKLYRYAQVLLHVVALWVASSELLYQMHSFHVEHSNRLALSILWGAYAIFLIVLGIVKQRGLLRWLGIGLFTVTLLKLFLYDILELNSLGKTIAFMSLGVFLLLVSFLYNKYKHIIFPNETKN